MLATRSLGSLRAAFGQQGAWQVSRGPHKRQASSKPSCPPRAALPRPPGLAAARAFSSAAGGEAQERPRNVAQAVNSLSDPAYKEPPTYLHNSYRCAA